MAKKSKDAKPNPPGVTNRDLLQRLNFLYQASAYLQSLPSDAGSSSSANASSQGTPSKAEAIRAHDLAATYTQTMKAIGRRATLRMDPLVKRTLCKECGTILTPSVTARVRVKKSTSHRHKMVYICTKCNASRHIPAPPLLQTNGPLSLLADSKETDVRGDPDDIHTLMDDGNQCVKVRRSKPGGPRPKSPPFFARPSEHALFQGNIQVIESDGPGAFTV